ncbi:MAG: hypothetical protein ACSHYB_15960 [Roseibacillus sp.]
MKNTTFCQIFTVGALSLGGFSQSLLADGPTDLEALAEKAKQAAGDAVEATEKAKQAMEGAETAVEEAVESGAEVVKEVAGEAAKELVDPAERAEKLGLLSNLSKDVAAVTTLNNGKRVWGEVTESKIGGILLETLAENDVDLKDPESPAAQVGALFQEEFLIATGKGTPKQFDNLIALSGLSDKYQTALMVRLWTMGMNDEEAVFDANPFGSLVEAISDNPDFLVNLISAAEMPPILLAARVSDDEQRDEFAAGLEMGAGMALQMGAEEMPFLKSAEAEVAGVAFNGLSVDGALLVEALEEEMGLAGMLENFLDPASAKDLVKSLSEKSLVLLAGVSDEAVYLYLGTNAEGIPLVDDAAEGLASSAHFEFADPYLDENLVSLFWMEEEMVQVGATAQGIFGNYIEGIRLGLQGNNAVGDTKNLKALLEKLEKLEKGYLATGQSQTASAVSFLRADGLYTEGFGGYLDGVYDYETPHQMGTAAGDTFLTIQSVMDPEVNELSTKYIETAMETVYEMASLVAEMEDVPADFEKFLDGFQMFDTKMKEDALALWQGLEASGAGLGNEFIYEVDLAGSWPTVPGVPEQIIEKGLAPRLSYVMPVTDRAELATSWKELEGAATKILKTVSEMVGEEIPMQKPMSSQNDGLKTWFFAIPTMTDDFIPSITLDDEVMVMGTSKERAVELAQSAKQEGAGISGVVVEMNFEPLQTFLSGWLALVEENPEEILTDEDALDFFEENQELLKEVVEAMEEFDSVRTHTRLENGVLRSSSHLKTK